METRRIVTAINLLAGVLVGLCVLEVFASELPKTTDLRQAAMKAGKSGEVLVLYVSMEDCPYCAKLEAELLNAAYAKGELDMVHFVELEWADLQITDFDGSRVSTGSLMEQYGVVVTPTVLFLGSSGEELSDRLVGYQSREFYWHYLMEGIAQSRLWGVD